MHCLSHLFVPGHERHFDQTVLLSESAERVDQKVRDLLLCGNAEVHDVMPCLTVISATQIVSQADLCMRVTTTTTSALQQIHACTYASHSA